MYIHIIICVYIYVYILCNIKTQKDHLPSQFPIEIQAHHPAAPHLPAVYCFSKKKTQFSFRWVHHERERLFLVAKLARRKPRGAAIDSIDQPSWMAPKQKRFVIRRGVLPNMGMPEPRSPLPKFPTRTQGQFPLTNPTEDQEQPHPRPPNPPTTWHLLSLPRDLLPWRTKIPWNSVVKTARIATLLGRKLWTMWNQWCANESRIQQSAALVEICIFPPALRRENIPWIKMGPAERIWDWLSWDTSAFLQMFCAAHPARLIAGSISFVPLPREQRFYWKLQFTPI